MENQHIFPIQDIDNIIIDYLHLNELFLLSSINKYYYDKISQKKFICEIKKICFLNWNDKNRTFDLCFIHGLIHLAQYIFDNHKQQIDMLLNKYFITACFYGHLNMAQWLVSISKTHNLPLDIHKENELLQACKKNYFDIVKWLIEISLEFNSCYQSQTFQIAFRFCCQFDNIEIAEYLFYKSIKLGFKIDIHDLDDLNIRYCLHFNQLETAKWLLNFSKEIGSPFILQNLMRDSFIINTSLYIENLNLVFDLFDFVI